MERVVMENEVWPELNLEEWEDTYDTLHLWMQMVGKIKLEFTPFINHWWNITFSLTASGLTTGVIPYGKQVFEIEFDFIEHRLYLKVDDGRSDFLILKSGTAGDFYKELKEKLEYLGIEIHIWPVPVEMEDRTPFGQDCRPRIYDPYYANRYWRALMQTGRVMNIFRSAFTGKASPVHFFWGSLDLALTFFSGKPAPVHPKVPNVGRKVMAEAYNAELASFGFWGGKGLGDAAFYAYAYPEPAGYKNFPVKPEAAFYHETLKEFILPYAAVEHILYPEKLILEFFRSCFKAVGASGNWNKELYRIRLW